MEEEGPHIVSTQVSEGGVISLVLTLTRGHSWLVLLAMKGCGTANAKYAKRHSGYFVAVIL